MGALVLAGRILLGLVFGAAGLSKLASIAATRAGLIEFGVPRALAGPTTALLILVELSVAITMLINSVAWLSAIGALVLLISFSIALAANLASGRRPKCNCFGQLQSDEIGWHTVARNLALAVVAGGLVAAGRHAPAVNLVAWLQTLSATRLAFGSSITIVAVLLATIALLLLQVLRQQGRMLLRFDAIEQHLGLTAALTVPSAGLEPGIAAPMFSLPALNGGERRLETILQERKPALLVFSHPGCGPCLTMVPQLVQWQRELSDRMALVLLAEGNAEENREKFGSAGLALILLQSGREVADAYQAHATPAAVIVSADGRIASFLAQGAGAIQGLVDAFQSNALPALPPPMPQALPVGEPVPDVALETLSGMPFRLSSLRGKSTLLVFWNQGCGFCQTMVDELRTWEARPHPNAPQLLLVSSSAAAEHQGLGLASTILLDGGGRAAQAFGAHGTPMGILVDGDGRIASQIATGSHAIFTLAGRTTAANGATGPTMLLREVTADESLV